MNAFSAIVSLVGAVPVVAAGWYWLQRFQRGRHLLGFGRTMPVDVVLTTSAVDKAIHGVPVNRPLTGYGQVRGVASCAGALVSLYPRKHVNIHLSGFIRNRLDRDLIALGGPAKNETARAIVDDFPRHHDLRAFRFDDADQALEIADHDGLSFRAPRFAQELSDGYPTSDYGLIIVSSRKGQNDRLVRAVLCAGFTTYGTAAAADYLFTDLVKLPRSKLYGRLQIKPVGRPGDFLIVVFARFSRGECTEVRPEFELKLRRRR